MSTMREVRLQCGTLKHHISHVYMKLQQWQNDESAIFLLHSFHVASVKISIQQYCPNLAEVEEFIN